MRVLSKLFILSVGIIGFCSINVFAQTGEEPSWIGDPGWDGEPSWNGDEVSGGGDTDFSLDDLEFTSQEYMLNLQKLGFIKTTVQLIEESNINLYSLYQDAVTISQGNYSLQEEFQRNVLGIVKDEVKNHSKVIQTVENIAAIRMEAKQASNQVRDLNVFDATEREFFTESYSKIIKEADDISWEIGEIVIDNNFKMKDGERIDLVYTLYESSEVLLKDIRKFNAQMKYAANLRLEQDDDYNNVKLLFTLEAND
jgi:hypothetical protein